MCILSIEFFPSSLLGEGPSCLALSLCIPPSSLQSTYNTPRISGDVWPGIWDGLSEHPGAMQYSPVLFPEIFLVFCKEKLEIGIPAEWFWLFRFGTSDLKLRTKIPSQLFILKAAARGSAVIVTIEQAEFLFLLLSLNLVPLQCLYDQHSPKLLELILIPSFIGSVLSEWCPSLKICFCFPNISKQCDLYSISSFRTATHVNLVSCKLCHRMCCQSRWDGSFNMLSSSSNGDLLMSLMKRF